MDTNADDLAELMDTLDLKDAVLVGHSTGGGVVARYIGRHGTKRVAKTVLIAAVTPLLLKTPANPDGVPFEVFEGFRKAVIVDRPQFCRELTPLYFGANRSGAKVSQGLLDSCWRQDMLAGFPAANFQIAAFSETDTTEDLRRFDVPTLILHGDDDQIVPVANAYRSSALIRNSTLKVYPGAPHALIATSKNELNEDLLGFIETNTKQQCSSGSEEETQSIDERFSARV